MTNQDNQFFNEEKTLFQKRINEILKESRTRQVIEDLIKLHMLRTASKNENQLVLVELYDLLGPELYSDMIEIVNGRTVDFPSMSSFKDTVQIAISYYYKYLKNKSWAEIKQILQEEDTASIKLGINCTKLNQFINEMASMVITNEIQKEKQNDGGLDQ
jgi:hypothetical protein